MNDKNRKITEVMTSNPQTVRRDEPLTNAARIMRDSDSGIVPVVDDSNKVLGVVTDRDIVTRVIAADRNVTDARVSDAMTSQVHTLKHDATVSDVHDLMRSQQVRRVPIVNERGELVGIVAQADLATRVETDRKVGQTVEEISRPEMR